MARARVRATCCRARPDAPAAKLQHCVVREAATHPRAARRPTKPGARTANSRVRPSRAALNVGRDTARE
eukprot:8992438-Lingulodinium_polyedra.AAC.1